MRDLAPGISCRWSRPRPFGSIGARVCVSWSTCLQQCFWWQGALQMMIMCTLYILYMIYFNASKRTIRGYRCIYIYIGRHCICFVGRNAALEISNCLRGQSKWLDRGTQAHIRLMLLDFPVSCWVQTCAGILWPMNGTPANRAPQRLSEQLHEPRNSGGW